MFFDFRLVFLQGGLQFRRQLHTTLLLRLQFLRGRLCDWPSFARACNSWLSLRPHGWPTAKTSNSIVSLRWHERHSCRRTLRSRRPLLLGRQRRSLSLSAQPIQRLNLRRKLQLEQLLLCIEKSPAKCFLCRIDLL